jgi:Protein of unknown function (DUF3040)
MLAAPVCVCSCPGAPTCTVAAIVITILGLEKMMSLSLHERRILADIEQGLATDATLVAVADLFTSSASARSGCRPSTMPTSGCPLPSVPRRRRAVLPVVLMTVMGLVTASVAMGLESPAVAMIGIVVMVTVTVMFLAKALGTEAGHTLLMPAHTCR